MALDLYDREQFQININSDMSIDDLHVEHHFYGRYRSYRFHQYRFPNKDDCSGTLNDLIAYTKNIGRKCVESSFAVVRRAFTFIKNAIEKTKFKKQMGRTDEDAVTLTLLQKDIQEIKALLKELHKHKCPSVSEEIIAKVLESSARIPPPPPPPPLAGQMALNTLPRTPVTNGTKKVACVTPIRPTISLDELLKVKLKKPSERTFQMRSRKLAHSEESTKRKLRSPRKQRKQSECALGTELPPSPVSSLKRLLSNNVDANIPKRRRK